MKTSRKNGLFFMLIFSSFLLLAACSESENKGKTDYLNSSIGQTIEVETISTEDVKVNLEKDEWVIVDTRSNDAFNGWPLDGVERGGHIPGAVDFSANWLTVGRDDKVEKLEQLLKDKGITKDKNVILYDANGEDALQVAQFLTSKGFEHLYQYDVKDWAESSDLAMESYPNYEKIVPAAWVNNTIENKNDGLPFKIFEVSWGEAAEDYKNGHIPGAVHINTDEVEEGPVWNRLKDKELEKFAMNNGITADTTVILYGSDSMPVYRVAVILKYMGVEDVRVLNGGYAAWANSGFDVETEVNSKQAVAAFGVKVPANPHYIIDMAEALNISANKNAASTLVDIRSWDEFTGKTSGYEYIEPKGRPAEAIWGHAGTDSSNLDDFRNPDDTMRNGFEIKEMWQKDGINIDNQLAFYCGTGWRAAEVLWYADVLGLENITLFDGGWNEWSMDSTNLVETGEPK